MTDQRQARRITAVSGSDPAYRACDDETLICRGTIYAFPIWEISPATGMIILYAANPATGQLILDAEGRPQPVSQVPTIKLARPDARGRAVWDYVGQTIRDPEVREAEHGDDKCWADLIVDRMMIIEQGMWDKKTRDGKEIAKIAELLPRFNKEHNEHNPHRIPLPRQLELRHARDRAAHRELWLPPVQRAAAALAAALAAEVAAGLTGPEPRYPLTVLWQVLCRLARWVRSWPADARLQALCTIGWSAAVVLVTSVLTGLGVATPWALGIALVTCAIPVGAGRKRRRRRRH